MRILVINYEFPPVGGGGGDVSSHISKALTEMGHEVRVLTVRYKGLPKTEFQDGYHVKRIFAFRMHLESCSKLEMVAFCLMALFPMIKETLTFRPHIAHIHFAVPTGPLGWLLKKLLGIPYVVTLHGGDVPGFVPEQTGKSFMWLIPLIRPIWKNAAHVVAVSIGLRDLARRTFPEVSIKSIPNGVDCNFFHPPTKEPKTSIPLRMITAARLNSQKGIPYLLEALYLLKSECEEIPLHLDIYGDGPDRNLIESLVNKWNLSSWVTIHGWVSRNEVNEAMGRSHLFVLPSVVEGMPIACLQAMAVGLPVLATRTIGSEEVVQDKYNGSLVPVKDPQALKEKLLYLISKPEVLEPMRKASRELALTYDWHNIAKKYEKLFTEAIVLSQ